MVQMDGSFHAWLEERGPEGCLIDLVDDATNTTWAQLGEQETIWAVVDALRVWIERYGVPLALYVDWKNLYKRPATAKEQLARRRAGHAVWAHVREVGDRGDRGQFAASQGAGGAASRHASGPAGEEAAAEGNRQSRSSANVYLEREYLPEHNRRFARAAAKAEDYHRRAPRAAELDRIFRLENERTISERLGGALRESVFPTGAAESPLRAGAGQSVGVRRAAREDRDRVSRAHAAGEGNSGNGRVATASLDTRFSIARRVASRHG